MLKRTDLYTNKRSFFSLCSLKTKILKSRKTKTEAKQNTERQAMSSSTEATQERIALGPLTCLSRGSDASPSPRSCLQRGQLKSYIRKTFPA